jgi:cytochrome c oxidase subunit 2
MTEPRRSGPSPAIVLLVATGVTVAVFLGILVTRGPDIGAQLSSVWESFFPPDPTTTQGRVIDDLYTFVFVIAAAIFLFVEALIVYAVVRYRRRPDQQDLPPQVHGNNVLEIVWTIIPTVIVAVMFVFSWQALNTVDVANAEPGELRVRAIGTRFQWTFEYLSDDGQTVRFRQFAPEMNVPAGRTIHLSLQATDVIHAFYVPQFLFKRDVVPGKENAFEFDVPAEFAGQTFHGQCAELCGAQHWAMQFSVIAMAQPEFDAWLQQQIDQASASPSPPPSGAPPGTTLKVSASNEQAFDQSSLTAPADEPFSIVFQNDDDVQHNVEIKTAAGESVFRGEIFQGPGTRTYGVPPQPAGAYAFICTVHPNMTGDLTVE